MKTAISVLLALAFAPAASAQPKPANPGQELVNMEAAWSKAIVARDAAALNRIVAPDWHGQGEKGKYLDRATMVRQSTTGADKVSAMTNHDVHVRLVGNDHAIVQGMDTETGTFKGKTATKVYSWTDIFEKRGGHWVAIASQNTPVKP
jgi:hypothetical protein